MVTNIRLNNIMTWVTSEGCKEDMHLIGLDLSRYAIPSLLLSFSVASPPPTSKQSKVSVAEMPENSFATELEYAI